MSSVMTNAQDILLTPTELAAAIAAHESRAAVLALAVAHVQDSRRWADDGSVSMRAWLRGNCCMSDRDASAWVRRGKLLNQFEPVAEAAIDGLLSHSQLTELERCNRPKYEPLLRPMVEDLVNELAPLDAELTAAACLRWRERADALIDENEPPEEPERSLHFSRADDGALIGKFVLDDAAGTELAKAIQNALTHDGAAETRDLAQRQGDALYDIAAFFNKNWDNDGTPRNLPNVSLSVHADTLQDKFPEAVNDDEQRPMSGAHADALLCDCVLHKILRDEFDQPIGFGRSRYTVSRKQFRQLVARDGGCRFPNCNRKAKHTDAHHIRYWRNMGLTDLENLVLLCSRHHHLVHALGLALELRPNGELHVTWADGRHLVSAPRHGPPRGSPADRQTQFAMA